MLWFAVIVFLLIVAAVTSSPLVSRLVGPKPVPKPKGDWLDFVSGMALIAFLPFEVVKPAGHVWHVAGVTLGVLTASAFVAVGTRDVVRRRRTRGTMIAR